VLIRIPILHTDALFKQSAAGIGVYAKKGDHMLDDNDKNGAYQEALKSGKTRYSSNVGSGKSGNIPSLDDILQNIEIVSEVNLGTIEIPLSKIRGTYTHSRGKMFAKNFMPIAKPESEFAAKWKNVYAHHIKEGISDPIIVCEYLNWFYVIEGNKRTSVLKFLNAYSVRAEVRRVIPRFDEHDPQIKTYYEFLKFNKKSGIFSIWFSDPNGFIELSRLLDLYIPEMDFDQNKYMHFLRMVYKPFRELYHRAGGAALSLTTADALLSYLQIYGVPQAVTEEIDKPRIKSFLSELRAVSESPAVSFQTEPIPEVRKNMISTLTTLMIPKKKVKVAFVYALTREDSGWTYAHDLGRQHIEHVLGDHIETTVVENVPETPDAYTTFRALAEEGHDIIFATRSTFIKPALKAALEFPDVRFLACSAAHSYKNVTTYSGRIYEPRFLMGLIAGSLTKSNVLGYMGEYPIPEVVAGINAFTLGARMVNPRVTVKVAWSYKWDIYGRTRNPEVELRDMGADFISHDGLPIPDKVKKYGLYSSRPESDGGEGDEIHYAMSIWHWGIFYEKLVSAVLSGTWKMVVESLHADSDLLQFWWGMDSGIVDIFYSLTHVPADTQKLVDFMRNMIIQNEFNPFKGPIYDQNGKLQVSEESVATHDQIITMDWFVEGVEGEIPSLDRTEISIDPLTDQLGIRK
jgi:basic membrane lipoprotein Med (substrate-binding protein (PBP1-ABC) superfamily)